MIRIFKLLAIFVVLASHQSLFAQTELAGQKSDSSNTLVLNEYNKRIEEISVERIADSIRRADLQSEINSLRSVDNLKKEELLAQLKELTEKASKTLADKKAKIDSLRLIVRGYPVIGPDNDTLFEIYSKIGSFRPVDRASSISEKIRKLYKDDFLKVDSIISVPSENTIDIVYGDMIIMSISESDAIWKNETRNELAKENTEKIKESIIKAKKENRVMVLLLRIGLVLVVIAVIFLLIWLINKGHKKTGLFIFKVKDKWLRDLAYKDYTFLTVDQELTIINFVLKLMKWFFILLLLYLILPIIFSIFPFSKGWASLLFGLVWSPLKDVLISIWKFIPNLFTIIVIYFVFRYSIKFVKYIFSEIESENLKIAGFYKDWAMPTFGIVRFLLYAFMFVLIFPYLPGSDSSIFKGVSVFLGVLFSLGSTSAISNMIAGLVITYMRPFKIGDRIKIGDITGDVIEKNMLVTRIHTIKNEEITIPNASVLSGNTINYSTMSKNEGLIIHTTVTIGYDVAWKDMHQALIDAALRTKLVVPDPKPFVLQTSLDDFYVSYQINAYTREANKQAVIYSELHQNIQDVCFERGIEILSPHYKSVRDGNIVSMPAQYIPEDYKSPGFIVNIDKPQSETDK